MTEHFNWTPELEQHLKDEYATLGRKGFAEKYNINVRAVECRVLKLGLSIRFKWTDEWLKRLKEEYPLLGATKFKDKYNLPITINAIGDAANRYGISINEDVRKQIHRETALKNVRTDNARMSAAENMREIALSRKDHPEWELKRIVAIREKHGKKLRFSWTPEWIDKLRKDYPSLGAVGFIRRHNLEGLVPVYTIVNGASMYNVRMDADKKVQLQREVRARNVGDGFVWTDEWLQRLKEDYPLMGGDAFCEKWKLNVEPSRVRNFAIQHGLRVNVDIRHDIRVETRIESNRTSDSIKEGARKAMTENIVKWRQDPEWRRKQSEGASKACSRPEHIAMLVEVGRESLKRNNTPGSEEYKRKIAGTKALWAPGGFFDQHPELKGYMCKKTVGNLCVSQWELDMLDVVRRLGLTVFETGQAVSIPGWETPRYPDVLLRDKKVIIEFDGYYWHCEIDKQKHGYEIQRDKAYRKDGWKVFRLYDIEWVTSEPLFVAKLCRIVQRVLR